MASRRTNNMKNLAIGVGEVVLMIAGAGVIMATVSVLGLFGLPALVVAGAIGERIYKFFK